MRLILDANRVSAVALKDTTFEIVLPAYVLAEILLRSDPEPILQKLTKISPKLGLEPAAVFDTITPLNETQIRDFEPFAPSGFGYSARLLDAAKSKARQIKDRHFNFCGSMFEMAKIFRKALSNTPNRNLKFASLAEVVSADPSFREMVVNWVRNGDKRQFVITDQDGLYNAMVQNPYLGNFFKTILYYLISFSRAWKDQKYNFDPTDTRDDWTDITLPLYAAKGDFILTDDKGLRNAVTMIDPSGMLLAGPTIPTDRKG